VSTDDLACARRFFALLAEASKTGERTGIYELLAQDVEWLTPKRDIRGLDEARSELTWIRPPDHLDVEFTEPELTDLGHGLIHSVFDETYRLKTTGDFAYARHRRVDLTIRDGKIARYEMRVVG
jgi:ketosteroid isomerase-like protein